MANYLMTTLTERDLVRLVAGRRGTDLLERAGSLRNLLRQDTGIYRHLHSPHAKLAAARELVKRALEEELHEQPSLTTPQLARDYLRVALGDREYEAFLVMFLDARNHLLVAEELFRGTLNQTNVYPREIVKRALLHNAAAVVFAHNHPSGHAEPSHADELLTRNLQQALALVDVKVLDHFIVGRERVLSFAETGRL